MEKQIIGFATQFYTLWSYHVEPQYTTDAYGQHHFAGNKEVYTYYQNISKDLAVVKAKYPNVTIDESLRGKTSSFELYKKLDLPAQFFSFGKWAGHTIQDVAKQDFQYLIWFTENRGGETSKLIKQLPHVIAYYQQKEREEAERHGVPALLESGLQQITISTNGRENFNGWGFAEKHDEALKQYYGMEFMVATIHNEVEFPTNIVILLPEGTKFVDGLYPYHMPIINGKAQRTKNKTLTLNIEVLKTELRNEANYQIAILK